MSTTDGKVRLLGGELHIGRAEAKRAYERLRKRSYRAKRNAQQLFGHYRVSFTQADIEGFAHAAYVEGLRDAINALSGGGSKL